MHPFYASPQAENAVQRIDVHTRSLTVFLWFLFLSVWVLATLSSFLQFQLCIDLEHSGVHKCCWAVPSTGTHSDNIFNFNDKAYANTSRDNMRRIKKKDQTTPQNSSMLFMGSITGATIQATQMRIFHQNSDVSAAH